MTELSEPYSKTELARAGFTRTGDAAAELVQLGELGSLLLPMLGKTADPDTALSGLVELLASDEGDVLSAQLGKDEGTAMRLLCVLGASEALTKHLLRHPEQWRELADPYLGRTRPAAYAMRAALVRAVGADPQAESPVASGDVLAATNALRVEYRRQLLRLSARDLTHNLGLDDAAAEISDLAAGTLDAALAVARHEIGHAHETCRLAVIAMGKCGGHELNYVSDVDVIFVAEAADPEADDQAEQKALRAASQLASAMMRICSEHTAEGTLWEVDPNLRPEGKSGALVRTLSSHQGYYERWAKTWEFQALLKARAAGGDAALGRDYLETIKPMVWTAVERDGFVEDVQAMRRRVIEHIPAKEADRQLKLGPGGLRDVEFAVQLLQLVHGRADEKIQAPTTLSALAELTRGGYVGREDGQAMHDAYSFLRTLEHRIQLYQLRRIHVVPDDEEDLRRLGRSMGFFADSAATLMRHWNYHKREVRRLHEKLFYRPLLNAVASVDTDGMRLTAQAAQARLAALGYLDPKAALRNLQVLTSGVSRTSAIQRTLLPVMLEWFADAPNPDAGLFGFRKISEALGSTPWYLRLLRDEGQAASRMAQILATSRYATDLLEREPTGVQILGEQHALVPMTQEALLTEMRSAVGRRANAREAVLAVRAVRRRELLRISVADLCEPFGVAEVGYALSELTTATLQVALESVIAGVEESTGMEFSARMAIVAMGRYGGQELGYGSDADAMFVYDPHPGADEATVATMAKSIANELRTLLAQAATDPVLDVDADLRPEGKSGPLVRSLASYQAYYDKWSEVWEAQALLRAAPVIGDQGLCADFATMIDPLRYPEGGLEQRDIVEIRRIKARVDEERLPRGADPKTHLKLGRGGLSDIEWTVQLLQLRHAGDVPGLRTPRTLDALTSAAAADLISEADAGGLSDAWRFASRARNATVQVRGKPSNQLPRDARELAAVARILGYEPGESNEMVNDHLRTSRQARSIVDSIFWK